MGWEVYLKSMSRICFSMSLGWSSTGTFVNPGKLTKCLRWSCLDLHVADNLGTNLVKVIEPFIRDVEKFWPFVLSHSWVRAGGSD